MITAAEAAEAEAVTVPHAAEAIRDIPRTCPCTWQWDQQKHRFTRISTYRGCPWHEDPVSRKPALSG